MLLGTFALSAALIAGVGLFASLSYFIAQRSREIAIRVSLGAGPWRLVREFLLDGMALSTLGGATGLLAIELLPEGEGRG